MNSVHFRQLEQMYFDANIQKMIFDTPSIKIGEGEAEIGLTVEPKYFHALDAIHGAVYFKLLDDATFFAVNSVVEDVFVLTTSFNLNIIRPATEGKLRAVGKLKFKSRNLFVAEATLYNEAGKKIAFETGNFAKSRVALSDVEGYQNRPK